MDQPTNAVLQAQITALSTRMDGLATKDDISELKAFMGNVNVGLGIVRFSWNNAGKIGGFAILLMAMGAFIKFGLIGALAWLIPDRP